MEGQDLDPRFFWYLTYLGKPAAWSGEQCPAGVDRQKSCRWQGFSACWFGIGELSLNGADGIPCQDIVAYEQMFGKSQRARTTLERNLVPTQPAVCLGDVVGCKLCTGRDEEQRIGCLLPLMVLRRV
jgi:hypothetical protein